MLCDKYKEALMGAAAEGAALPSAASEHVNLCAHCRAIFAEQQSLFALVDGGLRSWVNVAIPGNFDHRVRAALQGEVSQDRKRYSALLAFGSLAAAALLMAILLTQGLRHGREGALGGPVLESKLGTSPHPAVPGGSATSLGSGLPSGVYLRRGVLKASPRPRDSVRRNAEVEVLVPQGQEELLVKYMQGIAARRPRVTLIAGLQHEPDMIPVRVPSIEISELVVTPLSDLSSN